MKKSSQKILLIAGPSGVGKSTLIKFLVEKYPQFKFPVSATTREMREGEAEGESYYFFTEAHFKEEIDNNSFLEWEVYADHMYGSLKSEYERYLKGDDVFLVADVEVLGAMNLKNYFGDQLCSLFIRPESVPALVARLQNRGTDSKEEIEKRKNRFEKELAYESRFDEVLINKTGQLEQAQMDLVTIIQKHFNV